MIGLAFAIIGQILFWASVSVAVGIKLEEGLDYQKHNTNFIGSLADLGFWLTFLGIIILIWG